MKTRRRALIFLAVLLVAVVFGVAKIGDYSQDIKVTRRLETYLHLPFKVKQVNEPSLFSFISGLDVVVEIPGGKQNVFNSFERRLRLDGMPVKRTGKFVGYQRGDLLLQLTHISQDTYRIEETFAI